LFEFLGWYEDEDNVFLAMEYFPLGTLDKFIREELKEEDARVISAQLLEGLKIMHEEGFAHRDLKPQARQLLQRIIHTLSNLILTIAEYLCGTKLTQLVDQNWRLRDLPGT
jgi:serine/threonine protein kinase